jgi:hypothetical protein
VFDLPKSAPVQHPQKVVRSVANFFLSPLYRYGCLRSKTYSLFFVKAVKWFFLLLEWSLALAKVFMAHAKLCSLNPEEGLSASLV